MAETDPSKPAGCEPEIDAPWSTEKGRRGGGGPHLWQINWVRDLAAIGCVLFLIWFGYYLRGIFTPLLIALFLAYLFHPLITRFERKWNVPRPATICGLMVAVVVVAVTLGWWLVPALWSQITDLAERLPAQLQTLADRYDVDTSELITQVEAKIQAFRNDPAGEGVQLIGWAFAGTGHVAGVIESLVGTMFYVVLMLVLIPFYFFFFAWQFGPLTHAFDRYLPEARRDRIRHVVGRMDRAVSAYFRERVWICGIMAVMFWLGWWVCGVPYALLLGLAAGLLSLVPYIGGIMWPIAMLLAYLERTTGVDPAGFSWWWVVIGPSVVYAVVQFVEGWVLTPWIQGKSMEMSAVTILVVVFIGGAVGGLYGMILCIPIAACVKILVEELALPELKRWAQSH